MIAVIFSAFASVIAGIFWWQQIARLHGRLVNPLVTFGNRREGTLTPDERKLVLGEHVKEQRWAFGLTWFAVAVGVILGSILVGRFVLAKEFDKSELAGVIALAGDITVATGAFRLYKKASEQLQKAIQEIHA
jgi:hypothetical protein